MEARFGHDFTRVRVHTDARAANSARAVGAIAYTVGHNVVFGQGRYVPSTSPGDRLLAHELAHVVQQLEGVQRRVGIGRPNDVYERHADAMAHAVMRGRSPHELLPGVAAGFVADGSDRNMVGTAKRTINGSGRRNLLSGASNASATFRLQRQKDQSSTPESAVGGTGALLEFEAIVRELYVKIDLQVFSEAKYMLSKGVPSDVVAKWINEARNEAKSKARTWSVLKRWAEERNKIKYGNKIGPSYEQLKSGDPAHGIKPKTDLEIIESAGKPNRGITKWAGKLRIAGRILLVIDLGIAAYKVSQAPTEDRPKVFIKEATGLAGAIAGGWLGAEGGAWAGAGIGVWFGGAGAAPGAAIGAIVGGIGGAIGGAWAGAKTGDWLVDTLYPVKATRFEEGE